MPRKRNVQPQAEKPDVPEESNDSPPADVSESDSPKVDAVETVVAQPKDPVDREPRLTAKQMFRAGQKDHMILAFLHVEGLRTETREDGKVKKVTRKLTRAEWTSEFETFRTNERR